MTRPVQVALGLLAIAGVVALALRGGGASAAGNGPREPRWEPLARRVTVDVRNASGRDQFARHATVRLRRGGLDVVTFGNADVAERDTLRTTHRVLVHRGDTLGAGRIIEVLGPAELIDTPDASRLVDFTVLLARVPVAGAAPLR